jgi:response regulator RpfG family c-di-GMP phosphodiesterase
VRLENENAVENIRADWKIEQKALRTKIEQSQERLNNLLTTLKNNLEKADDYAKSELNKQIKDLQQRQKLLESDLKQIDTRVADNWDEFKNNVEEHLEDTVKQIEENI